MFKIGNIWSSRLTTCGVAHISTGYGRSGLYSDWVHVHVYMYKHWLLYSGPVIAEQAEKHVWISIIKMP